MNKIVKSHVKVFNAPCVLPRSDLMLADRGVKVDYTTTFRWLQAHAAELEKRLRSYLRLCNGWWRVGATYI